VIELLAPFDLDVLLFDPYVTPDDEIAARARLVGLDELFERSSIVTVHAPLLPETIGMIGADQLGRLAPYSTVINTARGPIIDHGALEEAIKAGPIRAILDVTAPEPLPDGHPLRGLPGVVITPHLAGAQGNELRRLGASALREIELFTAGSPAAHPVEKAELAATA
jgi:phosphoglycerate dehydrogenase-like enzyme